jgi:thiol-disulfide isomerase/thioredoxin
MMKKSLMLTSVLLLLTATIAAAGEQVAIGAKAPAFSLVNTVDGKTVAFKPGDGKLSVVVFTCNHCPYAKAFEPRLIELGRQYAAKGVAFYAINSNDDVAYEEETTVEMRTRAKARRYPFPYLKDGDSNVARAYGARVTPHVFVVDKSGAVRYRGYVDDTGLTNALDQLLAGKAVTQTVTREFGCSIKFKT